jgi:hypothetical protein
MQFRECSWQGTLGSLFLTVVVTLPLTFRIGNLLLLQLLTREAFLRSGAGEAKLKKRS